ncbi:MAG: hypothetical protein N2050_00575, partial [Flavobacteriales bacterium]|nr:hypothetical protein [Flavobacteriales bacterium]
MNKESFSIRVLRKTCLKNLFRNQRIVLIGVLICTNSIVLQGQNVGINVTGEAPDPSAILDVKASDKGFLLPRVSLTSTSDMATVSSCCATGLLVYNTNNSADVAPGFYYWDGSLWVPLSSPASGDQGWLLKGNSGTDPDSNFVGTIDSLPLVVRVHNQIAFKFNTNGSIQRDGGGHLRGPFAVDFQALRDSADMVASGDYSAILSGQNNIVTGPWSVVVGGLGSIVYPKNSFVGGGGGHLIDSLGGWSVIAGGMVNTTKGKWCSILGGDGNKAFQEYATIAGGYQNEVTGYAGGVFTGFLNEASGDGSFIGGGFMNQISPAGINAVLCG